MILLHPLGGASRWIFPTSVYFYENKAQYYKVATERLMEAMAWRFDDDDTLRLRRSTLAEFAWPLSCSNKYR
jgi:hypothetical protein